MKSEEDAAAAFAGGLMQHGYQCGMIWGATLAAGAQAYRILGPGPQAEAKAIIAAQRLVEAFRARNNHVNCLEITDLDRSSSAMKMTFYFLVKGGAIGCFNRTTRYANVALGEIDTVLSEDPSEAPCSPTSCAAVLAQKLGASDIQTVMAAGFAGGIGLSGGACGALGTAIWLIGLSAAAEGSGNNDYNNPVALAAIDRFMKSTDFEFECSNIVGREFVDIDDHANYLRQGGCSNVLDVLMECHAEAGQQPHG